MVTIPKELEELRQQIRGSFKGLLVSTQFSAHVSEYNARQRLRKIGFVSSVDDLSDKDARIFLEISSYYDKLESDKQRADSKKKGR